MTAPRGVSVVIPVYNGAKYLGAAIESVLAQTVPASEVIVVDDGSNDGSAEVARAYGGRVKLICTEHAGGPAATNTGVTTTSEPLLAFLDADDLWTASKLESQVAVLQSAAAPDMVFGLAQNFRAGAEDEAAVPGISKGTILIPRQRWLDVGPLDESLIVGDFIDWFARAQDAGLCFVTVDEVLLRRRLHESNTGIRSAGSRSQYALVAKRALDRRRQGASGMPIEPPRTA